MDYRFRLRRRLTGSEAPPSDLMRGEMAYSEPGTVVYIGHGAGAGDLAAQARAVFRSDGTRLWHGIVGAADGSTEFIGDGSALTGVPAVWASITGLPAAISSVAALTPAADRLPYYTDGSAAALATLTAFGRNLLDDADAAAGRTTLGLGTAATATVQTSGADNTAGRVLALPASGNTGTFGLGGNFGLQLADLDAAVIPSGLYFFNTASGTTGTNPGFAAGAVLVLQGIGTGTNAPLMIAVERSSGAGRMAWRSSQGGTWGAWQTAVATGHNHAIADVTGLQAALDGKQPAITTTDAALTADVNLSANNSWTDAVTLSLAAGTWLLQGHVTFFRAVTTAVVFQARISDGTTHHASGQQQQPSVTPNNGTTISLSRVVTLSGTTTIRLQGACLSGASGSDNRMLAQLSANASGNTATVLTAVKIA
jgi:hypothetical protein